VGQPDDPPNNRDLPADDLPDHQPDSRWMTFDQLARARGISKLSAQALVRRHDWRRQRDNRGRVLALVPNDGPELRRQPDNPPDDPSQSPHHQPDNPLRQADHPPHAPFETALAAIEAAHARELHALRERADAAQAQADRTSVQLEETEKRADRTEQAVTAERSRADALRERLDAAESRARTAEQAAEQARQHAREAEDQIQTLRQADEDRKARGRWARLKTAWRGD
jgi:Alanine-zipper, major outer membrane lipoprotein